MTRQSAQLAKLQLLKPGELLPCKQYGYRVLLIARAGAATIIAKQRPTNEVRIMRRILTSLRPSSPRGTIEGVQLDLRITENSNAIEGLKPRADLRSGRAFTSGALAQF